MKKNETAIIDTGVPFIQLPLETLSYFDSTFFGDNWIHTNSFIEGSWGWVGSDYGGLPEIDFRFQYSLKYSIKPRDYMSPPKINTTTKEPYWRLGIYDNWSDEYPKLAGLGRIFIKKYSLYIHVFRNERTISVGFKIGEKYTSFSLIVPILIYYFCVIAILSSLSIWLSCKKCKRIEEENKRKQYLMNSSKIENLRNTSRTMRRPDYNMHTNDYTKVFERHRANTVTN